VNEEKRPHDGYEINRKRDIMLNAYGGSSSYDDIDLLVNRLSLYIGNFFFSNTQGSCVPLD
jgi:hypothetical protein